MTKDIQVLEPLWNYDRMVAEAEAIAASWHRKLDSNQIYRLRTQILMAFEYLQNRDLAARAQDAETIATLRARIAELEAQLARDEQKEVQGEQHPNR